MRKTLVLCTLICALLIVFSGMAGAQTPEPPSPTPIVVTATPMSQIIVVTATPSALPAPKTLWDEHGKTIVGALVGLLFGGILVWMLKPAFERLGNAVAEGLGRLGSGWGFRKRYLTHLIEEYRGLNIRGLKTKAPVTVELERVYVSLYAQVPDVALGRPEPPALSVGQAMAQHARLAILGGPGTGKTTLLAYLTLTYARGQARKRVGIKEKRLPIFVPLRRLKRVLDGEDGVRTLPAYLAGWYTELGLRPREGFFEKALQDGRCLVLLDGLDEVADEAERRRMSEWVDRLVTIYPRTRYIITSRPSGYESAPLENGFTVLRIRDFAAEEIRQFATNWCLAVEVAAQGEDNPTARRRAQDAARDLEAAIEANADIRKLAVNPLLLSIIALVHHYRDRLPRRRVDLYGECVDVLLGHWDAAKGLAGRLSPGQKRAVLQPLALGMHREKRRDISRRELEARIGALLPAVGGQAGDAADFVDEVRERSGLLVEAGLGTYAFSHLTFQEYLAAQEVVDNQEVRGLLLEQAGDEWWREVTLLYAGMADATPIVGGLLAAEEDETCTRLLLAGWCVAEAARVGEPTRKEVTRRLEEKFAACTGELFLSTGQVLAEIAGEDSVDFFLHLAHDDARRRGAALWALGQMGRQPNEALRERVQERLLAYFQGEDLRQEAGAALAEVWGAQMVAELSRRGLSLPLVRQGAETLAVVNGRLLLEAVRSEGIAWLRELLTEAMDKLDDRVLLDALRVECDAVMLAALAAALDRRMVEIPAGEFLMGDKNRKVFVDAFWIGRYPVTNAQYKRFVDATGHKPPRHWQGNTYPADRATHPVVYVTWDDAVAYAKWAGKRLPTEEEWEKAARGTDGRMYPWGNYWEEGRCNTSEAGIGNTTPVGHYSPGGDSPYGCADMAGNVWEWTASAWEPGSERRVVRGGSWDFNQWGARCAYRYRYIPDNFYNLVGLIVH